MNYCISSRQSSEELMQADEIYVKPNDWRMVLSLFKSYPKTTVILETGEIPYTFLKELVTAEGKLVCCVSDLEEIDKLKKACGVVHFYYKFAVSTFYDVNALIALGVEYVKIAAPLTFQLDKLKDLDVKFRMVPNVAYDAYIPRENGLHGQWVRPEDVSIYESAISVFEFEAAGIIQEKTLLSIYRDKKEWLGNLNMLITNFGIDIDNRSILDAVGLRRANCGQVCQSGGSCKFCEIVLAYSNSLKGDSKNV